LSLSLFPEL